MGGSGGAGRRGRRRLLLWGAAASAAVLLAVGLWAFEPWRLATTRVVDEAPPTAGGRAAPSEGAEAAEPTGADGGMEEAPAEGAGPEETGPEVLAEGEFVSQEHRTSGTAEVIELADGTRHVRLEGLATSDGPDLYVWLTDQEAGGDWFKYRDGRHLDLGELKGTHGDANYAVPADADIDGTASVVIWCDRFSVAFGSAPLDL
ncbi:DM13 domain-containing protein [Nocardiopsis potens]|uniref:DM13 domain-containing protein n=1 Tax=Nocardiopsis potens TaxID=1246458 RepID=UPI00034C7329|nr:DM13 domain-containing protein [Nocardiopsis potens]